MHLETRLAQLDSAIAMELWQVSFLSYTFASDRLIIVIGPIFALYRQAVGFSSMNDMYFHCVTRDPRIVQSFRSQTMYKKLTQIQTMHLM